MKAEKKCTKCGVSKPLTLDYYHRSSKIKDGYRSECIECRTGKASRHYDPLNPKPKNINRINRLKTLKGYFTDCLCNSLRSRHRKKWDYESDLTVEHLISLWEAQEGRCYWLKVPLLWGQEYPDRDPLKLSFERLDNSIGYMIGNVVLASNLANKGRGSASVERFSAILKELGLKA